MPSIASIVTGLGIVLILHSAYSCEHYRSLVSLLQQDQAGAASGTTTTTTSSLLSVPPVDVIVETFLGFILCLVGFLVGSGPLLEIHGKSKTKLSAPSYQTRDFDIYENRNKALFATKKSKQK